MSGQQSFDAAMLYTIIFGSEDFEHLIGELELATQFRSMSSDDVSGSDESSDYFRFKQRKRELTCAVLLAAKLDVFAVDRDEERFVDAARREVNGLAETKLGGALLDVIGRVYREKGRAHLSMLHYCEAKVARMVTQTYRSLVTIGYTLNAVYGA